VRLIEDLLDATRILSGQLRLARQLFALKPVVVSALESVRAAALARQVTLHTNCCSATSASTAIPTACSRSCGTCSTTR